MRRQIKIRDQARELLAQSRRYISESARLQVQCAFLRRDFERVLADVYLSHLARHRAFLKNRARVRFFFIPKGTFNMGELEHVNPKLDSTAVQFELAKAIRSGRIEFFQKYCGSSKYLLYRERARSRRSRRR